MLHQSGYLTIKGTKSGERYILKFPNGEVRFGFLKALIPYSATASADGSLKNLFKIGASFDGEKRTIGEWIIRER